MPLLDYRCECGHTFEILTTIAHSLECPKCGSAKTERMNSVSAMVQPMDDIKNMDPKEIWIRRKHKAHLEYHLKTGRIKDYDDSREKHKEFRPDHQRRIY